MVSFFYRYEYDDDTDGALCLKKKNMGILEDYLYSQGKPPFSEAPDAAFRGLSYDSLGSQTALSRYWTAT